MKPMRGALIRCCAIVLLLTGWNGLVFGEDMMEYMSSKEPQSYMFTRSYLPRDSREKPYEVYAAVEEEAAPAEKAGVAKEFKEDFSSYIFRKLHPYAYTDFNYNSNIYLTQTGKKDDLNTTTLAGTKFIMGRPGKNSTMVQFDGGMKSESYIYSGFNRQQPYASVEVATGVGEYKFGFNQSFRRDFSTASDLVTNEGIFTDYWQNSTRASVDAKFNRVGLDITYRREAVDYEIPFQQNGSQDNGIDLMGFYKPFFFNKTNILAEYEYGKVEYTKALNTDNNYFYNLIWVGVVGPMTKKISGYAKIGYEYLDYANNKDHTTLPAVKVELKYRHSARTELWLRLSHLGLRSSNFAYSTSNGSYASVSLKHYFGKKISAEVAGYVLEQYYQDPKYTNTGYGASARLMYVYAKWIKTYLEYRHDLLNTRGSNDGGYVNNIYSFKTDITF